MIRLRHLGPAALLAGCSPSVGGGAFAVIASTPEPGEVAYPQSLIELEFSEAIDSERCGPEAVHLAAVAEAPALAWLEPVELVESEQGEHRWTVLHDPLRVEQEHVLSIASGPEGCVSFLGKPIEPFSLWFLVVERTAERG